MSTATISPDPPPLRRRPVPVTQPRPALRIVQEDGAGTGPSRQAALRLPLTNVPVAEGEDGKETDELPAPRRTPGRLLPEPGLWAAQFVQAAVEVTMGLRPSSQLTRWVSDDVRGLLARRAGLAGNRTPRGRSSRREIVRSTRVSTPRDGVAEAAVVLSDGVGARAVALRMEGLDGRWRVTALQLG